MTTILYTPGCFSHAPAGTRRAEILEQLRAAGFEPKARRDRIDCWTATMPEEGIAIFAATLESLLLRATVALLAVSLQRNPE